VALTLSVKGTTCWLCGMAGADSADHDPPRSVLIRSGVRDPDALGYLNPAHLYPCNQVRGKRPVTDELRAEVLAARLAHLARASAAAALSPRLARRRPSLLSTNESSAQESCASISPNPEKKFRGES
jgi:hypothetical protein